MRLNTFDEIQITGLHPRNPITGQLITAFLQTFMVTYPIEGGSIAPIFLTPRPEMDMDEMIPIGRVCRLNGVALH